VNTHESTNEKEAINPTEEITASQQTLDVVENIPPPPSRCPGGFFLGILPGQTLSRIAQRFNITVDEILAVNPQIANPNLIFAGQIICVPVPAPKICPPGFIIVIATSGTTFFGLTRIFQTTTLAIQQANSDIDPRNILIGSLICVPTPLVPTPEAAFPCCLILEPAENLDPDAGGTAFIQALAGGEHRVSVITTDLPAPESVGDFDAYAASLTIPSIDGGFGNELFAVLLQPPTRATAFTVPATVPITTDSFVHVIPFSTTTGIEGSPVLAGRVENCT